MTERILVHRWRAAEDAILVGGATVRADNPALDVRLWKGKNPLRVIVSRSGSMDQGSKVFNKSAETLIFTCNDKLTFPGVRVIRLTDNEDFVTEILTVLHGMGVQSLFVEGGAFIIGSFVESGLWDEARRFTGPVRFGEGVHEPFTEFIAEKSIQYEKSILDFMYHFRGNNV